MGDGWPGSSSLPAKSRSSIVTRRMPLFFSALLQEDPAEVDAALAFFREHHERAEDEGSTAAETYVGLLARVGHSAAAVEAAATLLASGRRATRKAPTLLELSRQAGDYRAHWRPPRAQRPRELRHSPAGASRTSTGNH